MNKTTIAWCLGMMAEYRGETVERQGYTWNPTRGCSRVSDGCIHCYAEGIAARFSGSGLAFDSYAKRVAGKPRWTGKVDLLPEKLADPLKVRRPGAIFVNSMSDLFHESLTFEEIAAVVGVMAASPQHLFMTLTKRAVRMREWFEWMDAFDPLGPVGRCLAAAMKAHCDQYGEPLERRTRAALVGHQDRAWPLPNWRIGVSAEDQQRWDERVPELLRCPAAFRFVSAEPLLSGIDCRLLVRSPHCFGTDALTGERVAYLSGNPVDDGPKIDQVIVGPESGRGARPMDMDWARSIRDQCQAAGCAFFMKQVVTESGKKLGIDHFPEDLKIQESSA